MEPMNCTADVRHDSCEVWGGIQAQTWSQGAAAKFAGLPPEKVNIHTTMLGGGLTVPLKRITGALGRLSNA